MRGVERLRQAECPRIGYLARPSDRGDRPPDPEDAMQRDEVAKSYGLKAFHTAADLPPLKWSFLKYVFRMEDKIDGKEEAYG